MARATDFLSQTSGKLDEMFQTRQTDHGTILARNPKRRGMTRRSEKQANTRCQLANVSANYQLFRCKKMQSFEGKEAGQNDFNIFVQVNYDRNPVFITKQDRKCGGCVLGNYQYSLGSLNPIAISLTSAGSAQGGGVLVTNIGLGSLVIDANTTVGEFSAAVLANNKDWQADDQLTFFYAEQMVDSEGVPRASMDPYRMVMNTTDQTKLWNVVSALGFSSVPSAGSGQGYVLGMGIALSNAGGSWIHSRNDGDGEKQVSTQRMKVVSDILASYQGEAAFLASAKSYGGINTREDFLDPVSTMADLGVAIAAGAGGSQSSSGSSGSSSGSGSQSGSGSGSGSGTQQGGGSETPTVNAPTISGDTPFEETTEVTMSGPADATIHYTLDGSTPTSASTAYTEALTLTDTTTVKAIAVKDNVSSSVASRTFTKGSGSGGGVQGED